MTIYQMMAYEIFIIKNTKFMLLSLDNQDLRREVISNWIKAKIVTGQLSIKANTLVCILAQKIDDCVTEEETLNLLSESMSTERVNADRLLSFGNDGRYPLPDYIPHNTKLERKITVWA